MDLFAAVRNLQEYFYNEFLYSVRSFSGDATIRDHGFWGLDRYEIVFPEIPLNRPGKYAYSARGLPMELTFCLAMSGLPHDESFSERRPRLRGLTSSANVKIRIAEHSGAVVCEISAPLSDWVLGGSIDTADFWHEASRDLRFRRNRQYTVVIQVDCSDSTLDILMAIPTLKGGGNEY